MTSRRPSAKTRHIVVMGVAGVGKTTVARQLAADLDLVFAEGDDYHLAASVQKMSSGVGLTDEDRWRWLDALADWTREQGRSGRSTVLSCSALRKAYRDVLRSADAETFFIHLAGTQELLRRRMESRQHFMPVSLLASQLATLEPLEPSESGVTIDVSPSVDEVVSEAAAAVRAALGDVRDN